MSFGQELKDFLAAAQAGQKIIGAADDRAYNRVKKRYLEAQSQTIEDKNNDTVADKLTKDAQRALISNRNASTDLIRRRGSLVDAQTKAFAAPPPADPMLSAIKPAPINQPRGAIGDQSALPLDDTTQVSQAEQIDPAEETQAVPVAMASSGGSIQHFADGGSVEADDEEADDGAETADEAAPEMAVGGTSGSTDISAASSAPGFSQAAAHDAVKGGMQYGVRVLGLDRAAAVQDPGRSRRLQAYARGAGAAPATDMEAVRKAVDPQGKMGESERNLAAMAAVYQYKLGKDDISGAQRAAFSMIQHYRVASQQYAAIAAAAVDHGDLDGAAKAAMKAYANVPDGKDFHVQKTKDGKLSYSFTDQQTGKVIEKGIEAPDKLASAAMGFAQKGFDEALLAAAGQRAEKPTKAGKGAVDPDTPLKPNDAKTVDKQVGEHLDKVYPETDAEGKPNPKYDAGKADAWRVGAYQVQRSNPDLHPRQAIKAANDIMFGVDPQNLNAKPFEITDGEGERKKITFPATGVEIMMSSKQLAPLMAQRGLEIQRRKAEADKTKKEGGEEGALSKMGKAAVQGGTAAVDWVAADVEKAKRQYPEATARIKSAVGAVGQAASDAKDWVEKDLNKPPIWSR